MLGIPIGLLTVNTVEWLFHKYVLHGLGKDKKSMWSDHWHIHHKQARKYRMIDKDYREPLIPVLINTYELKAILLGMASLTPLLPFCPWFVSTVWVCGAAYYVIHRRSHLDEEWGKKWVPWHYDHHFGKNQDANWCVTFPLADYILGTRIPT